MSYEGLAFLLCFKTIAYHRPETENPKSCKSFIYASALDSKHRPSFTLILISPSITRSFIFTLKYLSN